MARWDSPLRALDEAGESLPLSQLAERLACVKSNITQLVDRLEADGLVGRKADPRDRRTRLAVMTAAGRKACTQGISIQQQTERDLFGALTREEEARQLTALMEKLEPKREQLGTSSSSGMDSLVIHKWEGMR